MQLNNNTAYIMLGCTYLVGMCSLYYKPDTEQLIKPVSQLVYTDSIVSTLSDTTDIEVLLSDTFKINEIYKDIEVEMAQMLEVNSGNKVIAVAKRVRGKYSISEKGKSFIKSHESCRLRQYLIKGEKYYTIGWGHQINPRGSIPATITQKRADEIFDNDMVGINAACNRLIKQLNPDMKITQGFVDGLCSLIYNCGEHGTETSKFFVRLKNCRFNNGKINKDDYNYAMESIKTSRVYMKGHKTRRKGEYAMMIK